MKKKWIVVSVLAALMLAGCSSKAPTSTGSATPPAKELPKDDLAVQDIVTAFFDNNYAYTETTEEYLEDDPGAPSPTVVEGKLIVSPYLEYRKANDSEVYFTGEGNTVAKITGKDGAWARSDVKRTYAYGYGKKDLTFTQTAKQDTSNSSVILYTTEYTQEIVAPNNPNLKLSAVISQTYYINEDTKQVVRIVTDLTDYTRKNHMLATMMENGISEEEAAKDVDPICVKQTLEITAYGDDVVIDAPFEESDATISKGNANNT